MDYRNICCACLCKKTNDNEFHLLRREITKNEGAEQQITLLECLQFCTHIDYRKDISLFICSECCMAMQVTYNFIQATKKSQEILSRNDKSNSDRIDDKTLVQNNSDKANKKVHYRCKLCGVKLNTKKSLKDHVKLHIDDLQYKCNMCIFSTKHRSHLQKHYESEHATEPTATQLKPIRIENKEESSVASESTHGQKLDKQIEVVEEPIVQTIVQEDVACFDNNVILNGQPLANFDANSQQYVVIPNNSSIQRIDDSNVIIEYVNEGNMELMNNTYFLTNDAQLAGKTFESTNLLQINGNGIYINEFGEMVTIENTDGIQLPTLEEQKQLQPLLQQEQEQQQQQIESQDQETAAKVVAIADSTKKSINCKICTNIFDSQDDLKQHMLTHQEIPHFYCDHCSFYTFFKIDITQHYKAKHNVTPTLKQLQARNKNKTNIKRLMYKCNMCQHITYYKDNLRRHYTSIHNIPSCDVQLIMYPVKAQDQDMRNEDIQTETVDNLMPNSITTNTTSINTKTVTNGCDEQMLASDETNMIYDNCIEYEDCNSNDIATNMLLSISDEENEQNNSVSKICSICKSTFASHYQLENHIFLHRGIAPYRCEMCTNLYNSKESLFRHYDAVHKIIPTRDMLQAKGDKVRGDGNCIELQVEAQTPPILMCGKCSFESQQRPDVQMHLRIVHYITEADNFIIEKLPFACSRCIRTFPTCDDLVQHLRQSHLIEISQPQEIQCNNKEKQANAVQQLNTATKSHNSIQIGKKLQEKAEEEHKCRLCAEKCSTIDNLEKHVCKLLSSGKARNTCSICQNKYRTKAALKHHMKCHARKYYHSTKSLIGQCRRKSSNIDELPHKCDLCQDRFRNVYYLNRHRVRQHISKRHVCKASLCGRAFATRAQFKLHAWDHIGVLPYKCAICVRGFKKPEILIRHTKNVHKVLLTDAEVAEVYRTSLEKIKPTKRLLYDENVP